MRRSLSMLAAWASISAACGCSSGPTFSIAPSLRPQALAIHPGSGDLAACEGAFALVASDGVVMAAGWNGGVVYSDAAPLTSVACDEDGHIFVVDHGSVGRASWFDHVAGPSRFARLPPGSWHVASSVDTRLWVWGLADDGTWQIFQIHGFEDGGMVSIDDAPGVSVVDVGHRPIRAAAIAGTLGLVTAIDDALVLWTYAGDSVVLAHVDPEADGLAVSSDGDVYVSTPRGIDRYASVDAPGKRIATGLHGPLALRGDVLYVRSAEQQAVIRLTPFEAPAAGAPP